MCAAYIAYKKYGIFLTARKPKEFWQVHVHHHNCYNVIDIACSGRDIGGAWMKGNIMSWRNEGEQFTPSKDWDTIYKEIEHLKNTRDTLRKRVDDLTSLLACVRNERDELKLEIQLYS